MSLVQIMYDCVRAPPVPPTPPAPDRPSIPPCRWALPPLASRVSSLASLCGNCCAIRTLAEFWTRWGLGDGDCAEWLGRFSDPAVGITLEHIMVPGYCAFCLSGSPNPIRCAFQVRPQLAALAPLGAMSLSASDALDEAIDGEQFFRDYLEVQSAFAWLCVHTLQDQMRVRR